MSVFIEILLGAIAAVIGVGIVLVVGTFVAVFVSNFWTEHRKTQRRH